MAREFIERSLPGDADFSSKDATKAQIDALTPDPDHMLWFEYNFLYVLAAKAVPPKKPWATTAQPATANANASMPSATLANLLSPNALPNT